MINTTFNFDMDKSSQLETKSFAVVGLADDVGSLVKSLEDDIAGYAKNYKRVFPYQINVERVLRTAGQNVEGIVVYTSAVFAKA